MKWRGVELSELSDEVLQEAMDAADRAGREILMEQQRRRVARRKGGGDDSGEL